MRDYANEKYADALDRIRKLENVNWERALDKESAWLAQTAKNCDGMWQFTRTLRAVYDPNELEEMPYKTTYNPHKG